MLLQYATTRRGGDVVLQIFEIARLFAEGRAEKPAWFFGMNMTDREFGIEILEAQDQLGPKAVNLRAA